MSKKYKDADEPAAQCDFSKGIRGKYVERLKEGPNVVVLDPDVASEFDSTQAVNRALRVYLETKKQGAAACVLLGGCANSVGFVPKLRSKPYYPHDSLNRD